MAEMEEDLAYVVASLTLFLFTILIVTVLLLKNKNDTSFIIWHFFSWINFIKWTALINSDAPESFLRFFNVMLKVLKPKPINTFTKYSEVPTRFYDLGLTHPYFLNNSELSLILLTIILLVYLVFFLIKKDKIEKIRKEICHNFVIRGILLLFLEFSIFAFLQLSHFEITTLYGVINSLLSVVAITVLLIVTFWFAVLALRKQEESDESKTSTDTLTQEFKKTRWVQRLFYLIYMLERLICPLVFALLQRMPHIQCLIIELAVGFKCKNYLVLYVLAFQPFTKTSLNYLASTLDATTMVIVALITSFMISMDDLSRETIFYFIVFFIFFGLFVSFFWFIKELRRVEQDNNCESAKTVSKLGNDREGIQVTVLTDSIWMRKEKKSKRGKLNIKVEELDRAKKDEHESNTSDKLYPEIPQNKEGVVIPKLKLNQDFEIKDSALANMNKGNQRNKYEDVKVKEFEYIKKPKVKNSALSTLNKEEDERNSYTHSIQKNKLELSPHKPSIQEIFKSKVVKNNQHANEKPSLMSIYANKARKIANNDTHETGNHFVPDSAGENRRTRDPEEEFKAESSVNNGFETQVDELKDFNGFNLSSGRVSSNYLEARLPFYGPLAKKYDMGKVLK